MHFLLNRLNNLFLITVFIFCIFLSSANDVMIMVALAPVKILIMVLVARGMTLMVRSILVSGTQQIIAQIMVIITSTLDIMD